MTTDDEPEVAHIADDDEGGRLTPQSTREFSATRLKRLRAIEELYLNGYCAREIHRLLGEQYKVGYGTLRNDIVAIRKVWSDDTGNRDALEGKDRYLASLRSMRRRVMKGWEEPSRSGRMRIVGRDYKLAHQIDKEIARISGVRLASDEHTIHLDIEEARQYMQSVMEVVFKHVEDAAVREAIVADIEVLGRR